MFNNAKIYVAGHTGLLGSGVLKTLKKRGCSNITVRTHKELDLTVQSDVHRFFEKERPEYVFMCAGRVGGIVGNKTYPAEYLHTNLSIQDNIFEAAVRYDVKNVVFYGSSCTYPKICEQPMKEEYWLTGPIEETSAGYAAAKIAGILGCRAYNNQYGTGRFICLLPNSMYGPNDSFDLDNCHVFSALIRRFYEAKKVGRESVTLWGTGAPRREFIFSEEVADASVFAVENADKMENSHYNIGSGTDCSIKELAEMISAAVGFEGRIEWDTTKPDGAPRKLLDSSKFMQLGWEPKVSLTEGISKTLKWFEENYDRL